MDTKLQLPVTIPQEESQKNSRQCQTKTKLFAAAAVILGLAVVGGLCAVVAVTVPLRQHSAADSVLQSDTREDLEHKEKLRAKVLEQHNIGKRQTSNNLQGTSCYSNLTNDSALVARIEGRGSKWGTVAPTGSTKYITRWRCSNMKGSAFVNGGINFTQDDQRLYFPKCGYYYVSSQVLFQYHTSDNDPLEDNRSVRHGIEITPNCEPYVTSKEVRYTHSSIVQKNFVRTSTYIGDVVKMCEGGSISVIIPGNENLCCAHGSGSRTHFSAFLIEETDCM